MPRIRKRQSQARNEAKADSLDQIMSNALDSLKQYTTVVSDSGECELSFSRFPLPVLILSDSRKHCVSSLAAGLKLYSPSVLLQRVQANRRDHKP